MRINLALTLRRAVLGKAAHRNDLLDVERLAVVAAVLIAERLLALVSAHPLDITSATYALDARLGGLLVKDDEADAVDQLALVVGLLARATENRDELLRRWVASARDACEALSLWTHA
jgi:hypothetical protein